VTTSKQNKTFKMMKVRAKPPFCVHSVIKLWWRNKLECLPLERTHSLVQYFRLWLEPAQICYLSVPATMIQGWKCFPVTNALAYFDERTVSKKKIVTLSPRVLKFCLKWSQSDIVEQKGFYGLLTREPDFALGRGIHNKRKIILF